MASTRNSAGDHSNDNKNASGAAELVDVRRIIGGLVLPYGVILLVAGLVDGPAASKKAAGIDISIWTGPGMAVFGAFFLLWMRLRPLPDGQLKEEPVGSEDHP